MNKPFIVILLAFFFLSNVYSFLEDNRTYIISVTDPHGFYSAHPHELVDADYPSLASFVDHLREQASQLNNCEIFFFENGDLVDGGGLTDQSNGKLLTFPILDDMGYDARNIGNHELYTADTMLKLNFPGNFVTSNIVHKESEEPFGHRYLILPSKIKNEKILVFGFLYDMKDYDPSVVFVENVEDCVKAKWFEDALATPFVRFIVVLSHMGYHDNLLNVILSSIRTKKGLQFPVAFITGHTHIRASFPLDKFAFSFEGGKFMDTIGYLSFPNEITNDFYFRF